MLSEKHFPYFVLAFLPNYSFPLQSEPEGPNNVAGTLQTGPPGLELLQLSLCQATASLPGEHLEQQPGVRGVLGHGPTAVSDTSGQLKQPGHISELLRSWSEEGIWAGPHRPSLQALGPNVSVPEPSTGDTSPGHWKSSSLEAQERHLMGCLYPSQDPVWSGCSLAHGE